MATRLAKVLFWFGLLIPTSPLSLALSPCAKLMGTNGFKTACCLQMFFIYISAVGFPISFCFSLLFVLNSFLLKCHYVAKRTTNTLLVSMGLPYFS